MGINSLGVVHQAREDIKELLEAGKLVKLLLLNPKSEEFTQRIKEVECKYKNTYEDFESHKQRLEAEWNSTIMILRSIAKNTTNKNLLEVRVRSERPTHAFSATVSEKEEECRVRVNIYPPEDRGTRGEQFLYEKSVHKNKKSYEDHMAWFETSWKKAEAISIGDEKWILP